MPLYYNLQQYFYIPSSITIGDVTNLLYVRLKHGCKRKENVIKVTHCDSKVINQSTSYCVRLFTQKLDFYNLPSTRRPNGKSAEEAFSLISTYVTRQSVFIKFGIATLLICFILNTQNIKNPFKYRRSDTKKLRRTSNFVSVSRRRAGTEEMGEWNIKYVLMRVSGRTPGNSNGGVH